MNLELVQIQRTLLVVMVLDFLPTLVRRRWAWFIELVFGTVALVATLWILSQLEGQFGSPFYRRYSLTGIAGSVYLAWVGARYFLRRGENKPTP